MEEGNRPAATASVSERVASLMERRSGAAVGVALLVTALLAIPFLTMAPEETASQDPAVRSPMPNSSSTTDSRRACSGLSS